MTKADRIELTIPAKAEYFVAVRLCAASLADRAGFDIDDIEDLKTAVAEACLLLMRRGCQDRLEIEFMVDRVNLSIAVTAQQTAKAQEKELEDEFGVFLLEALVDEVVCYAAGDCPVKQTCKLTKRQKQTRN